MSEDCHRMSLINYSKYYQLPHFFPYHSVSSPRCLFSSLIHLDAAYRCFVVCEIVVYLYFSQGHQKPLILSFPRYPLGSAGTKRCSYLFLYAFITHTSLGPGMGGACRNKSDRFSFCSTISAACLSFPDSLRLPHMSTCASGQVIWMTAASRESKEGMIPTIVPVTTAPFFISIVTVSFVSFIKKRTSFILSGGN